MKFTLSWLKEHLETTASLKEITDTLTKIGLEVEEVFNPASNLAGFVTAKVEDFCKHPNADKLHLLKVNTGKESLQVVCGAPNCKLGMVGIFAPVGTVIPLYNEALKVGKIRDVESFGMMCSEKELCLGDNHDGIIELDAKTPIGLCAEDVLSIDPVVEINITPNRAECLGVRGIARDLAAAGLGKLKELKIAKFESKLKSPVKVKIEDFKACPAYVGRYIKGVNNKASTPKWMKDRLTAIGLRSISPLVDITNYVNYDLAKPMHAFDADKLKGDVVVRMAKEGEKFVSLEEKEYALDAQSLGICDDEGVQCLAGIMGGIGKGCSAETKNLFLESAVFNPEVIARTGRKFQIESDSRYRYERFVDPSNSSLASDYATGLILEICGGEASGIEIAGSEKPELSVAYIRPFRLKDLIGLEVSEKKITEILEKLGFKIEKEKERLKATAPAWRGDIKGEHDLVEEVVRMIGLDEIPAVSMPCDKFPSEVLSPKQKRVVEVRHAMAAKGLYETVTWSFTNSETAKYFRKGKEPVFLANPIASDLDEMRPSILPNLLLACKNNIARGFANLALFEIGPEFFGKNPFEQNLVATGVKLGSPVKKTWNKSPREADAYDAKADAMSAIAAAGGPTESLQVTADAPEYYHPGRSGALRLGKNVLACFGELHPSVLKAFGLKQRAVAFEVFLDNIPEPRLSADKAKKKLELYQLQAVEKDFAFVVEKDVLAANVLQAVKAADKDNIFDVRLFDVYEGANLPDGKKSLAVAVTFQPVLKTYTDAEIETLMNKVIQAVKSKCGGELRA